MNSGERRAKRTKSSRRSRSPLVVSAAVGGGSGRDDEELPGREPEGEESEKIEVHVHVHRGKAGAKKKKKKRKPARPALTGTLFDWQGHYDRVCKGPVPPSNPGAAGSAASSGSSRSLNCSACGAKVQRFARKCGVCEAPQPRGIVARVSAVLGIASVIGVFALCHHILGDSAREHMAPEPLRKDFTDDDAYVVEVPAGSSPFTYEFSLMGPTTGPKPTAD
jgi:hypothetical protein